MGHGISLIGTITDRARATWVGTFSLNYGDPRYKEWQEHWLKTGKDWCQELEKQGEKVTIVGLKKVLSWYEDFQKKE